MIVGAGCSRVHQSGLTPNPAGSLTPGRPHTAASPRAAALSPAAVRLGPVSDESSAIDFECTALIESSVWVLLSPRIHSVLTERPPRSGRPRWSLPAPGPETVGAARYCTPSARGVDHESSAASSIAAFVYVEVWRAAFGGDREGGARSCGRHFTAAYPFRLSFLSLSLSPSPLWVD